MACFSSGFTLVVGAILAFESSRRNTELNPRAKREPFLRTNKRRKKKSVEDIVPFFSRSVRGVSTTTAKVGAGFFFGGAAMAAYCDSVSGYALSVLG